MSETKSFDLQDKSAYINSNNLNKTPVSIIQEYASKHSLVPKYNLIYNGSGTNNVFFKYSLELKGYNTVGEGASKKEAKHEAALKLLNEMVTDEPDLLMTEIKHWSFENHVVSPFHKSIKENVIGKLNDICYNKKLGMPEFKLLQEEGQPHAKLFTVSCCVYKMIEVATHKTKKQAKHSSAIQMVEKLNSIDTPMLSVDDQLFCKDIDRVQNPQYLQDKFSHKNSLNKTPVSIIQEYASKRCFVPQYNLIYNGSGTDNVFFKYSLELKGYNTIGEGASKKEAKHEAALKLLNEMVTDEPDLLKTEFKHWSFENQVVSPFHKSIKENAVGKLNDICYNKKLGMPEFKLLREEGQPHAKLFTVSCCVDKMIEVATHKTKKQAKHLSAIQMVEKLNSIDTPVVPVNQQLIFKAMEGLRKIKLDNDKSSLNFN